MHPVPDQKAIRIARLFTEQIVTVFGVAEASLSDRGANLVSHLMLDVCALLGTKKLNTTSYHPQCDGMVERFNRTLKTMIRKHVEDVWDTVGPVPAGTPLGVSEYPPRIDRREAIVPTVWIRLSLTNKSCVVPSYWSATD